jgi:hypothetical protein
MVKAPSKSHHFKRSLEAARHDLRKAFSARWKDQAGLEPDKLAIGSNWLGVGWKNRTIFQGAAG